MNKESRFVKQLYYIVRNELLFFEISINSYRTQILQSSHLKPARTSEKSLHYFPDE
jgi:hypothetical protein